MAKVNMMEFDPVKMQNWLDARKLTASEVSVATGHSSGYMSVAIQRGSMPPSQAMLLHSLYGFKLSDVQPDPEPVVEQSAEEDWQSVYDTALAGDDYQLRVKVLPDRLCVSVLRNGAVFVHAWSNRKSLSEVDTLQAISYAAHMCYKFVQQKELANGR